MALKDNQYFPQSVPHPGETLAEKLGEMGMPVKEFAVRTGKPEKTIIAILNGNSSITPDMAVQFENVTKIPAHFWMNHQRGYDEFVARKKHEAVIQDAVPWAASFPLAEMANKGWLPPHTTKQEKAAALLGFFGLANQHAWEDYYLKQELKIAFRISLTSTSNPYSISAWLRKGDLQAAEMEAPAYNEKKFREILEEIKSLMALAPANYFNQLQQLCLLAGVKLTYTPCIAKAPINGATRWLGDTPLIQMTNRYKRYDSFWFTFFHEAGHILLHGKKDIFLENVEYNDQDIQKEKEADDFAIKWTFSTAQEAQFIEQGIINDEHDIISFAKLFNTHPAMIIGRLQRKKYLPYSFLNKHFPNANLDDE